MFNRLDLCVDYDEYGAPYWLYQNKLDSFDEINSPSYFKEAAAELLDSGINKMLVISKDYDDVIDIFNLFHYGVQPGAFYVMNCLQSIFKNDFKEISQKGDL